MIGGFDTVVDGSGPPDEASFLVSALRRVWPDLVVQDASRADAVGPNDPSIGNMTEFFVYRSHADFEGWAREGATEQNGDSMIHVLLGAESTTFVTEGAGSETHRHADTLSVDLAVHRLLAELDAQRARVRAPPPDQPPRGLNLMDHLVLRGERRGPTEQAVGV